MSDPLASSMNAPSDSPGATLPDEVDPDPAPQREAPTAPEPATTEGVERGGTGEPVGRDNIRAGQVGGVQGGPHPAQGQGQGG
jgi:hypothetical protein